MKEASNNVTKQSWFKRHENATPLTVLLCFAVAIVIMQLITSGARGDVEYPSFITPVNLLNILMQIAVPGIVAVGMSMVIIMGGIDLSVGMLASLVSIVSALGISVWGLGLWPALLVGILTAVILETLVGFVISRTKVEPFIMTLGAMIAYQGIALLLCNSREVVLQGELDFLKYNLIKGAIDPVNGLNLTITPYVVIFLLIVVIIWAMMKFSKFGRRIYAIGCNPNAAYLAGVNVKNTKLQVYAVHGLLVGIGAVLLLARINVGIITNGQNMEIDAIAMAVIGGIAMSGGKGNIWGTLIGILLLGSISNAMNMLRLPSEVSFVAKGVIIMVAVSASYLSPSIKKLFGKSRKK